jgi:hypothetical protein
MIEWLMLAIFKVAPEAMFLATVAKFLREVYVCEGEFESVDEVYGSERESS